MKFRIDFVTNSSSSSYIASFLVHTTNGTNIPLKLCENDEDGDREDNALYPWQHSRDHILKAIMNCETVSELTELLAEECERGLRETYFSDMLEDLKLYNPDEYERLMFTIKEFRTQMSQYTSLDELDAVILKEEFYGWGENATDNLVDFLNHLDVGTSYRWDEEALKEKLGEETANLLLQAVELGCGNTDGYINTYLKVSDGNVHTDADMDICTSW